MTYQVRLTEDARQDLRRHYAYMLEWDEDASEKALDTITSAMEILKRLPFSCRKAPGNNALMRELVIPFGSTGYVALFRVDGSDTVTVAAIRYQREDDYH